MHHDAVSTSASTLGPAVSARSSTSRVDAAAAGVAAAAVALGVSELIAALLPGATSLVAAVGQVVIDLQPAGAKDLVVALFGTNDKVALEVVVVLASLAFGAVLGILAARRFALAAAGFVAFGVLGFAAALGDPLANAASVAAQATVAVGLGVQTLSWLLARAPAAADGAVAVASSDPARRSFLLRTGGRQPVRARRGSRRPKPARRFADGADHRRGAARPPRRPCHPSPPGPTLRRRRPA